jgi:hypothetical protein
MRSLVAWYLHYFDGKVQLADCYGWDVQLGGSSGYVATSKTVLWTIANHSQIIRAY